MLAHARRVWALESTQEPRCRVDTAAPPAAWMGQPALGAVGPEVLGLPSPLPAIDAAVRQSLKLLAADAKGKVVTQPNAKDATPLEPLAWVAADAMPRATSRRAATSVKAPAGLSASDAGVRCSCQVPFVYKLF